MKNCQICQSSLPRCSEPTPNRVPTKILLDFFMARLLKWVDSSGTTVWPYVLTHAIHVITEAGRLKLSHSV